MQACVFASTKLLTPCHQNLHCSWSTRFGWVWIMCTQGNFQKCISLLLCKSKNTLHLPYIHYHGPLNWIQGCLVGLVLPQCELELAEGLRPVVVCEAASGGHPTVEVTPASEEPSQEADGWVIDTCCTYYYILQFQNKSNPLFCL